MHTVEIKSEGTRRSYTVHACTIYSAWQKAIDTVKILICSESDQVKIDKNKGTSIGLQNFCRDTRSEVLKAIWQQTWQPVLWQES